MTHPIDCDYYCYHRSCCVIWSLYCCTACHTTWKKQAVTFISISSNIKKFISVYNFIIRVITLMSQQLLKHWCQPSDYIILWAGHSKSNTANGGNWENKCIEDAFLLAGCYKLCSIILCLQHSVPCKFKISLPAVGIYVWCRYWNWEASTLCSTSHWRACLRTMFNTKDNHLSLF